LAVLRSFRFSLLLAASAAVLIAPVSNAIALEDGDTVRIVVGFSPGGGYDASARLAAPYFQAALRERGFPNVSVIVENITGGAGVMGAATVFTSPPDGTTVGILEPMDATWQELILNAPFKVTDFNFLGQQNTDTYGFMVRSDLEISEFNQLVARSKEKPILLGTAGRTSYSTRIFPVLLQQTLAKVGTDLRFDYVNTSGTSEARASISRGESESLLMGVNPSSIKFVGEGKAKFLFSFHEDEYPDAEDVLGLPPELFGPLNGAATSRRVYIAPPGMDEELLTTLQDTFEAVLTSEEFVEKSNTAGLPVSFLSGKDTRQLILDLAEFAKANRDVVEKSISSGQ
jgi:tripartite-type tricarboxylate transporter receptor subunit TctC